MENAQDPRWGLVGRDPFDQNFRKFRYKIKWNRTFLEIRFENCGQPPEVVLKFREIGPEILVKWIAPVDPTPVIERSAEINYYFFECTLNDTLTAKNGDVSSSTP